MNPRRAPVFSFVLTAAAVLGAAAPGQADPKDHKKKGARTALPPTNAVAKQVDRLLGTAWREAKVKPRRQASDAELLRRVSLDLTGVIPSEESARDYLLSDTPRKYQAKVRELLKSPSYARTQSLRWAYLLVGRDYLIRTKNLSLVKKMRKRRQRAMGGSMEEDEGMYGGEDAHSLDEWLAARFADNTPWDEVTTSLITANGTVDKTPAAYYMLRYGRDGKAPEMAGNVFRVFQGLQIQCAQCHDHPYDEEFSQRDFWSLAAFFNRTTARRTPPSAEQLKRKRRPNQGKPRGPFRVFDRPVGQARMPVPAGETGALVLPRFLDGQVINPGNGIDRRGKVAAMITATKNAYFAKATVNRVWSHFFGRGLINPVDEVTEPSVVPEVMTLLEAEFRASGYDMQRLIHVIVSTKAYSRSSEGTEEHKEKELEVFARAPMRSLSAEQLFYSALAATGVEEVRKGDRRAMRRLEKMKYGMLRQFVRVFGSDEEEVVDQGTIPEALMLLNGPLTNEAVRPRPGHPVYDRLFAMTDVDEQIKTIYVRVLGRTPTRAERNSVRKFFASTKGLGPTIRAQAYADVFWALMNSAEFNLIH
jgi:hypothetical protein